MGDEPKLYVAGLTTFDLLVGRCPDGHTHIFGFYPQITADQKRIDRERMVVTITQPCSECGAPVSQERPLTTDGRPRR